MAFAVYPQEGATDQIGPFWSKLFCIADDGALGPDGFRYFDTNNQFPQNCTHWKVNQVVLNSNNLTVGPVVVNWTCNDPGPLTGSFTIPAGSLPTVPYWQDIAFENFSLYAEWDGYVQGKGYQLNMSSYFGSPPATYNITFTFVASASTLAALGLPATWTITFPNDGQEHTYYIPTQAPNLLPLFLLCNLAQESQDKSCEIANFTVPNLAKLCAFQELGSGGALYATGDPATVEDVFTFNGRKNFRIALAFMDQSKNIVPLPAGTIVELNFRVMPLGTSMMTPLPTTSAFYRK